MSDNEYTVENEPEFERVYDEDEMIEVRRGDLRAVLDVATGSLDFGSGFLNEEEVEVLRRLAELLGIDQLLVTPANFTFKYGCQMRGQHDWKFQKNAAWDNNQLVAGWFCHVCRHGVPGVETVKPGLIKPGLIKP